jgi:hypothetical protein
MKNFSLYFEKIVHCKAVSASSIVLFTVKCLKQEIVAFKE